MILRMAATKRFFTTVDVSEETKSTKLQKTLREFLYYLSLFMIGDTITYIGWLDFEGYVKATKKTTKNLDGTLKKWLEEHKKRRRVWY